MHIPLELLTDQLVSLPGASEDLSPAEIDRINAHLEEMERELLFNPEVYGQAPIECPLRHVFAPGVYYRQITMPAGANIIGHKHRTRHLNIVLKGKALVQMNDREALIEGPAAFISGAGVRKRLQIIEDMVWVTIHPTEETDLEKLEEMLIEKSPTFLQFERDQADLQLAEKTT